MAKIKIKDGGYCRNLFVDINTFGIYRFTENKKVDSSANNVYATTFNECNTNDRSESLL